MTRVVASVRAKTRRRATDDARSSAGRARREASEASEASANDESETRRDSLKSRLAWCESYLMNDMTTNGARQRNVERASARARRRREEK